MGLGNWIKNKGTDSKEYVKKTINYEEVKETGGNIKEMASTLLSPKEMLRNAKRETFQEAKMRLGVTDLDLKQNYKNYSYIFYISIIFSLICFLFSLYYLFIERTLMGALAMIAIMLLCLANSFKFSFRAFQIKHQKLCSVKDWWDRANEWFPKI